MRRRLALGLTVLTASGLLALAAPGSAEAAALANCGGRKVRTLSFSTGYVQVFKQGRYVCAVTVAKNPGPRRTMTVSVQARGSRPWRGQLVTTRRIASAWVYQGQRCVLVTGSVGRGSVNSGWILC